MGSTLRPCSWMVRCFGPLTRNHHTYLEVFIRLLLPFLGHGWWRTSSRRSQTPDDQHGYCYANDGVCEYFHRFSRGILSTWSMRSEGYEICCRRNVSIMLDLVDVSSLVGFESSPRPSCDLEEKSRNTLLDDQTYQLFSRSSSTRANPPSSDLVIASTIRPVPEVAYPPTVSQY
jgi:hypothetical protein